MVCRDQKVKTRRPNVAGERVGNNNKNTPFCLLISILLIIKYIYT